MRSITTLALAVVLTIAAAACGGGAATSAPGTDAAPSEAASSEAAPSDGAATACEVVEEAGTVQAEAADFAFSPDPITASVGATVTWTNADSAPHTVTLDDGSCDSGQFGQGASATLRFNAAGTYAYHCALHPNMKGTVEVS